MGRPRKYQRVEDVPAHEGGHHLRQFDRAPDEIDVGDHAHEVFVDDEQSHSDIPDESLEGYIARHEETAQRAGLAVTKIVYPDAEPRLYPGKYAGIPVEDGPLSARYSDGSKH